MLAAWFDQVVLIPGLLPADLGPLVALDHAWFWDGQEHVDPAKEATVQATRLTNHTTTLAHEYARQGRDWEDALRQRAKEVALMAELGLAPAQAQATTSATDDPNPEEEHADEPARTDA